MNDDRLKIEMIRAMDLLVKQLEDEDAQLNWFYSTIENLTDEDCRLITQNGASMTDCCKSFVRLIEKYGSSGFKTGRKPCKSK